MDHEECEALVLEWIDWLRQKYTDVQQCGGGDLGRHRI